MATATKPAIFDFHIINEDKTTKFKYAHPVPTFLCEPELASRAWKEAFIDVISVITNQHHEECMQAITVPCCECGNLTQDALKSPMSYLHLAEPMVVVQIRPVCGSNACDRNVRIRLAQMQEEAMRHAAEHERKIYVEMSCAVCGTKDAKRCAGCGKVAYCGKGCQKEGWKMHKRDCRRRKLEESTGDAGMPYEQL